MKRCALLGLLLLLVACDEAPVKLEMTGKTMGTTYNIVAVDVPAGLQADAITKAVTETLAEVNGRMSNWDPNSEISRFNAQKTTDSVRISAQLAQVIRAANEIHTRSAGRFDVTLGPLIELWGFGARGPEDPVPSDEDIAETSKRVGQSRLLSLTTGPDMLRKARSDTSVYLAAIAKGYGVDEVARTLRDLGLQNFMVEIGGDLLASGVNAEGRPWRIGIERPDAANRTVQEIVHLSALGMATSGDYRNFFEKDGVRYSHIIDAGTGRPISHRTASVTVLAESAMMADGWATALLALGLVRGLEISEKLELAALFIVRDDGADSKRFKTVASTRFRKLQAGE